MLPSNYLGFAREPFRSADFQRACFSKRPSFGYTQSVSSVLDAGDASEVSDEIPGKEAEAKYRAEFAGGHRQAIQLQCPDRLTRKMRSNIHKADSVGIGHFLSIFPERNARDPENLLPVHSAEGRLFSIFEHVFYDLLIN